MLWHILETKNMRCFCLYKSCKWGGAIFTAYVTKGMLEKKKTASILNCLINKKNKI